VVTITTGYSDTCALTSSGGAKCWGFNAFGQLGLGDHMTDNWYTPMDVVGFP
jgi:alpha-tubulin suppressor-like RCC1 family protein